MSKHSICSYIYILLFSFVAVGGSASAYAQADTATADTTEKKIKKPETAGRQLCLGIDIFHPVLNNFLSTSYGYEAQVTYYLRNEFYAVAEGGWGGSKVDYTDLKYTTSNAFGRVGFNKSILQRDSPKDWDMMFIGFMAGAGTIDRSAATYTVIDSVWGNETGSRPGKSFTALWAEVTGGMRVELFTGLMAGWNVRGKFMLNGRSFKDLSPLYIAGYGKGDKNAVFDFNLYLSYAIRWKRATKIIDPKEVKK